MPVEVRLCITRCVTMNLKKFTSVARHRTPSPLLSVFPPFSYLPFSLPFPTSLSAIPHLSATNPLFLHLSLPISLLPTFCHSQSVFYRHSITPHLPPTHILSLPICLLSTLYHSPSVSYPHSITPHLSPTNILSLPICLLPTFYHSLPVFYRHSITPHLSPTQTLSLSTCLLSILSLSLHLSPIHALSLSNCLLLTLSLVSATHTSSVSYPHSLSLLIRPLPPTPPPPRLYITPHLSYPPSLCLCHCFSICLSLCLSLSPSPSLPPSLSSLSLSLQSPSLLSNPHLSLCVSRSPSVSYLDARHKTGQG